MTNEINSQPHRDAQETGLMDLLLILSDSIKILLLFPVLGVICATAFLFWQGQKPKVFVSHASIFVETPTASDEVPKVRAEVLVSAINAGDAFAEFKGKVTASLGRTDRLVNLSASGETPEAAQAVNHAALKKIYAITAPAGAEAARLQKLLTAERQRLAEIHQILSQSAISSKTNAENVRAYGELLQITSIREYSIAKIERQLSGLTPSSIVLAPTLPNAAQSVKKLNPFLVGLIAGGFAALFWIFTKHGVSLLRQDPLHHAKLARIKANLGLQE